MSPEETKAWIWSRCHEDGDCLLWDGGTDDNGVPYLRLPGSRKVVAARRALLEALGVNVQGKVATTTCGHPGCLAEEHSVAWTRKQLQKRSGEKHRFNLVRAAKIAKWRRQTAVLDEEKVAHLRECGLTTREAAALYGVAQSTAANAMRGDSWKDYSSPFQGLLG